MDGITGPKIWCQPNCQQAKHLLQAHDSAMLAQISTGEEGYTASGGNSSAWYDNGSKGMDFQGNLELVDFATVHLCEHPLRPSQNA